MDLILRRGARPGQSPIRFGSIARLSVRESKTGKGVGPRIMRAEMAEDWGSVLDGLGRSDPLALAKISKLVTGALTRLGAYDLRDGWDDVRQEVLIALLRSVREGKLREPSAFVGYTMTITRNRMNDWLRRKRSGEPVRRGEQTLQAIAEHLHPETNRVAPDLLIDLERALDGLPEKQRLVLHALYLEGRSYEEAAGVLGMPLGTLKRMQTEGLRALRSVLEVIR
jgi:RNA polymerase sigma-70 factor (ECF subfamily)